ncbi:MAG: pyridoxamine 5'-phosphate oxidase family protein [Spirochaetaceae bacterium]|nr:pyridoxamine 5'-phosphate oxidase family protein [Myxococcales bacterium]MCB9722659.1 pyridoxamine 5'-phosphate oxidase family protein [Spirochaetaceae bacterium]HPG28121.1 pyridoxamine 5'-phosphate oxidase family protein [Myxococcota bacterium]
MKGLSSRSAWPAERVASFLNDYRAPLRLAVPTPAGHPMICSLWSLYEGGALRCATQRDAAVVRRLEQDPRCAFELAPNEPPYFGVRGRGRARIETEGAARLLERLIDRHLGDRDGSLARWLLARADREVAIVIEPDWLTSWDYTERMAG